MLMKVSPIESKQIQRIPSIHVDKKTHPGYARVIQDDQVIICDVDDADFLIQELQDFRANQP